MALVTALVKFVLELTMLIIKGAAQLMGALLTLLFNALSAWMASRASKSTPAQHSRAGAFPPKSQNRRARHGRKNRHR